MTKLLLVAAALAVAAIATPASAQNVTETVLVTGAAGAQGTGQDASDRNTPELPVVYEDAKS